MSYQGGRYGYQEKADQARANYTGRGRKGWNPNWKKGPTIVRGSEYKPILAPSSQQSAIFSHIHDSSAHLVVQALAGTGKTSTSVECMTKYMRSGASILYVIFANRNAREAEGKCNASIEVRTCHAFGLNILKRAYGKVEVDGKGEKARAIAQGLLGPEDEKIELRYNFCKAMSLAKSYLCETVEQVQEVCDKHDIEPCTLSVEDFCSNVLKGLDVSAQQYMRVDFDDMLWLVVKKNLSVPTFDYVVADECQDLSPVRLEIVIRAIKPNGGKLLAIGDSHQAIFGFTGADEKALDTLRERTSAETLPLSMTYRCGKAIVEYAQTWVPEYEAAESNNEGEVVEKTVESMLKPEEQGGAMPGDFVISRVNAPLVSLCLQFVKQGRKANVMGKDLGKNLSYMVKRSNAVSVDGFLDWLGTWENIECERLAKRNKPTEHITDKADTLRVFCEGETDLANVRKRIEDMFSDDEDKGSIRLGTAHKSKGLETDRTWLLTKTFKCQGNQEDNVMYVACTRCRNSLYLVG